MISLQVSLFWIIFIKKSFGWTVSCHKFVQYIHMLNPLYRQLFILIESVPWLSNFDFLNAEDHNDHWSSGKGISDHDMTKHLNAWALTKSSRYVSAQNNTEIGSATACKFSVLHIPNLFTS